jgi:hypothetical protein
MVAGAVLAGPGLTVLLIGRIVLAAITEVYTFVVMRTFLSFDKEDGVKLPRRRVRVPVPVVPVIAVTVLAAGTAVALQNNDDKATERQKKGVEGPRATPTTGPCKDPIIRAIREKTGGC